jgi:CxxC motif-containing protein (DUF1111 family)
VTAVLLVLAAVGVIAWIAGGSSSPSGAELFRTEFTSDRGLGPLFNERSCSACHAFPTVGGVGADGLATATRVGRLTEAGFVSMAFAHRHAVCGGTAGIPAGADVTSVRNAPALFGAGRIARIPDGAIRAGAVARGDGVHGRPNLVRGRVGRFGWKADAPTLERFVADAFRNELGLFSAVAPANAASRCEDADPEIDADELEAVTAFVADLPAPRPAGAAPAVFEAAGCAACHTPTLDKVPLYSDLLLHDMGPLLDDRVVQASARGSEWRTQPLWGLSDRPRYLHDGRAETLPAAIVAHGGEAAAARRRFLALAPRERRALLAFLRSL